MAPPPTARRPSSARTAQACPRRSNSKRRITKDGTLPRLRRVATVCAGPIRACLPQAQLLRRSEGRLGPMQLALARTVAAVR